MKTGRKKREFGKWNQFEATSATGVAVARQIRRWIRGLLILYIMLSAKNVHVIPCSQESLRVPNFYS